MRISELAEATGTSVTTLKFYLRRNLLSPGTSVNRTQSDYGPEHVERVALIRALTEVGGLDLAAVGRVLTVLDTRDPDRMSVLMTAQHALLGSDGAADRSLGPGRRGDDRTREWIRARGWTVDPDDPAIDRLAAAWRACDDSGVPLADERMSAYADATEQIARVDVESLPGEPTATARQVILGTVLVAPVLSALRFLAQQNESRSR